MNIVDELNNEFSKQKSLYKVGQQPMAELERYKQIAMGYAEMENAVSVHDKSWCLFMKYRRDI